MYQGPQAGGDVHNGSMPLSRRTFIGTAAAGALAPVWARTLRTVGAQLYTLRNVLPEKPLETLQAVEEIGYREVEVVQNGIDKIWPSLRKTRLKPVAVHIDTGLLAPGRHDELEAAIQDARKRKFDYVVYPYLPQEERAGLAELRSFAARLNHAGLACRDAGMMLCYHNHAFEFTPMEGKTLLDTLMDLTGREIIGLELDIFWASVAGHDPVALLERYEGRVPLVHLKDKAEGTPVQTHEKVPPDAFKEVGAGTIPMEPVLRAAHAAGVRHYIVEQDQTPGDPIESLRQSFEYLRKLDF